MEHQGEDFQHASLGKARRPCIPSQLCWRVFQIKALPAQHSLCRNITNPTQETERLAPVANPSENSMGAKTSPSSYQAHRCRRNRHNITYGRDLPGAPTPHPTRSKAFVPSAWAACSSAPSPCLPALALLHQRASTPMRMLQPRLQSHGEACDNPQVPLTCRKARRNAPRNRSDRAQRIHKPQASILELAPRLDGG